MSKYKLKQRQLAAAVLAALLAMPAYGYAFQRDPEYVYLLSTLSPACLFISFFLFARHEAATRP